MPATEEEIAFALRSGDVILHVLESRGSEHVLVEIQTAKNSAQLWAANLEAYATMCGWRPDTSICSADRYLRQALGNKYVLTEKEFHTILMKTQYRFNGH